jgi:hypothetical protein
LISRSVSGPYATGSTRDASHDKDQHMKDYISMSELDCIFISYDEPNAEHNWSDLREKCFWADRLHGIKGSDKCHKAAADLSSTDWFITVDADNIVDAKFFNLVVQIPEGARAFSWPGVNVINGLQYGNGSLKVWHKDFVKNMRTHESADVNANQVDFCWEDGYRPMVDSYSVTHPNGSPFQAWRAGFREGVKMSLVDGVLPEDPRPAKLLWHNLHRLRVWGSIGMHVENGGWAMLGARHGCYKTNCTGWNYVDVRDFDALAEIWEEVRDQDLASELDRYQELLARDYGLDVITLDAAASEFATGIFCDQYRQAVEQITWTMNRNA